MKLKRVLIIFAMVATVAMVGCRTVSSEPPSSPTIPKEIQEETLTAVTETEAATEAEDIVEATEPTDTPPEEPYDGFTLVNSPDFEPFEFVGENQLQMILEREGIEGINFFKHTNPDSIKVGKLGDVVVGQVQMADDGIVWNFRIEKADDFVNNTGFDMSLAENKFRDCEEVERIVNKMTFIERSCYIDLTDWDEVYAIKDATGEWDLTNVHSIEISLVLNKTKSTLFTFYSDVYWVKFGENSMGAPIERHPIGMMKSESDYALPPSN